MPTNMTEEEFNRRYADKQNRRYEWALKWRRFLKAVLVVWILGFFPAMFIVGIIPAGISLILGVVIICWLIKNVFY